MTHPKLMLLAGLLQGTGAFGCTKQVVEGYPSEFAGVGLELKIADGRPEVVRPIPGGPSHEAGIEEGDRVIAIDGNDTEDMTLGKVVMHLRGKPNTQVTLDVDRLGSRIMVVIKRRRMQKTDEGYRAEK